MISCILSVIIYSYVYKKPEDGSYIDAGAQRVEVFFFFFIIYISENRVSGAGGLVGGEDED